MVYRLAKKDKRVFFIGSDLGAGILDNFKKEMPDRFLMEGVSEAHVIGLAAGLAKEGKIVYVNTIATFITRRCFEQNVLELGLHKLKVRLIGNGGGLVYAPLGPTHLSIDDIAIMRTIPNMTVVAPCDEAEMEKLMLETLDYPGPIYIRVAKGGEPIVTRKNRSFKIGRGYLVKSGEKVLVITTGVTLQIALEAYTLLKQKGKTISILHLPTVKPLDKARVIKEVKKASKIITIEEHLLTGGLGSAILEVIAQTGILSAKKFKMIALPDVFPKGYGSQKDLLDKYGITSQAIVDAVKSV